MEGNIIIYAALFDDYHSIKPIPKQSIPTKNILFTEKEIKVDGWDVVVVDRKFTSGRLENRFYKCLLPKEFSCDISIYVDSNLEISPNFAEQYLECLGDSDMCLFKHPSSKNISDEHEAASKLPKYDKENMDKLMSFLRVESDTELEDEPVYACTTIARRVNSRTRVLNKNWFYMNLISDMDQLSLPYCISRMYGDFKINSITDKNFMFNSMYKVITWRPD